MPVGLHLKARHSQVFKFSQVIGVLQMSTSELDAHLADAARENPLLRVRPHRFALARGGDATAAIEAAADRASSLYDHVQRELSGLIARGGPLRRVVLALIEELEPSGWLGRPLSELAKELRFSETVLESALAMVQKRVDPAGLFARDLEECLRLQLEERELVSDEMALVLRQLPVLEQGGVAGLARAAGLPADTVARCLAMLRKLDPKPGARFSDDPTLAREPDVRVAPSGEGWSIELRNLSRSEISVAPVPDCGRSAEMREAMAQARALKQSLDLRRSALEKVVGALVARQGDFFRDGPAALRPLTMSEVARETGFHLSTVSRVLNGLLIEGPNGIVEARVLCAASASVQSGPSKPKVLARLRALLRAENPGAPLSDQQLADRLLSEGLPVSRRVVAKYRLEIGALPAIKRRRLAMSTPA